MYGQLQQLLDGLYAKHLKDVPGRCILVYGKCHWV